MTTEQPKPASTTEQPQYPPPPPHFPFAGAYPPPPGAFPPAFFAYPPPSEGQQGEGGTGTPPVPPFQVMYGPPGVVYAFPPPVPPNSTPPPGAAATRPKRKQVKMACTNCAAACKRCDDSRPCERCQKYGIADTCIDGQRKERKKGVKRGPYKRKNKDSGFDYVSGEGPEWTGQPPSTATTAAAIHAVAQFAPPEGFYPIYYPPPGPYPPPDGQPGAEGTNGHPPPLMPLYIGGFPPYYAPPGAVFVPPPGTHPPPPPAASTTATTTEAGSVPEADTKADESVASPSTEAGGDDTNSEAHATDSGSTSGASVVGRKRKLSSKNGDGKSKKSRNDTSSGDADDGGTSNEE
ncbi:hypothetical protein VNI00_006531 [Paramarasmius palmivorus]|uniref:Zn(2)-C6 fungal-type domain-containing protein n=1 Tax=Paramarasmius palmivorus TaxID=297713 RepID=A0AAW0D883_9AGAR